MMFVKARESMFPAFSLVILSVCLILSGCAQSSIVAPARPVGFVPPAGTEQLFRNYDVAATWIPQHNHNADHKALYCGRNNGLMTCSWVPNQNTARQAMSETLSRCLEHQPSDGCFEFAVDGHLSPWAAWVADIYDPDGAEQRARLFADDIKENGADYNFRSFVDDALPVVNGALEVTSSAQSMAMARGGGMKGPGPLAPGRAGYSQRGAFGDCASLYAAFGGLAASKNSRGQTCADLENSMSSLAPRPVRGTYGLGGPGTSAPANPSTITGVR